MHRNYCFTWNNYTQKDAEMVVTYPCKYMVVGHETGENGTPHMQGYVEFASAKNLSTLKKAWGDKPHFEARKGTAKQASDYCKKDGDYIERGEISNQGKRSDLDEWARMAMDRNIALNTMIQESPKMALLYIKRATEMRRLTFEDRTEPPNAVWLWGSTGVGKTRMAFDNHNTVYIKDGTMWWDGYEQQEAIVIDDFDGKWPFRDLLRLLDRYPYQGQVKGGYVKINSPTIYITCDKPPERFWHGDELSQIQRRLLGVFHME